LAEERRRRAAAAELLLRHDLRPIVGGLELSILRHDAVDSFKSPSPYDLHFSEKWAGDVRRGSAGPHGVDPDLAAHTAIARSRGIALVGPEPATVLGEVPDAAFRRAVLDDARSITGGGIIETPFYGVLNLCRCLQLALDAPAEPVTKDECAGWAVGARSVEPGRSSRWRWTALTQPLTCRQRPHVCTATLGTGSHVSTSRATHERS